MTIYRQTGKPQRPDVLVCAGLDPSGGAGLIADTRVVAQLGGRPVGVVTALTIQNTTGVLGTHACDAEVVGQQLTFLMTDVEVRAVKLGMIGSTEVAKAIANALHLTNAPVVWDPIAAPSRGSGDYAIAEALAALKPHLALVTPNARELAVLSNRTIDDLASAEAAARALADQLDCAVLVKGGHLGGDESVDILIHAGGRDEFRAPRVQNGEHVHGTGCALSSAIATELALGKGLADACRLAKDFVLERVNDPQAPGRGTPAVL
ncbi:MAG TPA: hydroxymethylpyrimidine/phosphomethylpyrimidine kinase [Kofleriaceae bacterium]|jgi:hydroxymethylpyrimidine/phosphomethylpyrimidine kinase|nr:hydroxymethylpyrimidine/phosphomethylpyrimidine kinase [Kofleriaceae bacterium]